MKPGYEPETLDQKMGHLVEECGEVLAAAGKSLRCGLGGGNPELPEDEREENVDWLLRELQDLQRTMDTVVPALQEWRMGRHPVQVG